LEKPKVTIEQKIIYMPNNEPIDLLFNIFEKDYLKQLESYLEEMLNEVNNKFINIGNLIS
ncbi:4651_t:CDS:2, partial [Gigaspora margarita]